MSIGLFCDEELDEARDSNINGWIKRIEDIIKSVDMINEYSSTKDILLVFLLLNKWKYVLVMSDIE